MHEAHVSLVLEKVGEETAHLGLLVPDTPAVIHLSGSLLVIVLFLISADTSACQLGSTKTPGDHSVSNLSVLGKCLLPWPPNGNKQCHGNLNHH